MTAIIAHRGNASQAPENTAVAFRQALAMDVDGLEFDVHLTADGVPVVLHDPRLERTTDGVGWVRDHPWDALRGLDAGGWFSSQFAGEPLPSLADVLDLVLQQAGAGASGRPPTVLHLELKGGQTPYPGLAAAVLREVQARDMAPQVVLSSFDHHLLREAQQVARQIGLQVPQGALLGARLIEPWNYAVAHGFGAIHPHESAVDPELIAGCHGAGLAVRPYTVDDPERARDLLAWGVDGLITNRPAQMLALRATQS